MLPLVKEHPKMNCHLFFKLCDKFGTFKEISISSTIENLNRFHRDMEDYFSDEDESKQSSHPDFRLVFGSTNNKRKRITELCDEVSLDPLQQDEEKEERSNEFFLHEGVQINFSKVTL